MLGYRMLFTVPVEKADRVSTLAMEQLHAWLREKGYQADEMAAEQTVKLASNVEGTLLERKDVDGSTATRARIIENSSTGRWISELTVHAPASRVKGPSICLDIDSPGSGEDQGLPVRWTGTPRLAKRLLAVMPAFDRSAHLADRPSVVSGDEAEDLIDVICDPNRRGPVFIAGSDENIQLTPWIDLVARLLAETVGLAASYVLDPDATRTLSGALGASHSVRPGTVRTFLPGADPASDLDALRHRVLSTNRIVRDDGARLARVLGWKAREITLESPLPKVLSRLSRAFAEQLDTILTDRMVIAEPATLQPTAGPAHSAREAAALEHVMQPDVAEQASRYLAVMDLAASTLGTNDLSPSSLAEIARLAQIGRQAVMTQAAVSARLSDLQVSLAEEKVARQELAKRLDDEQLEHAETAQRALKAEKRANYQQRLLAQPGQGPGALTLPSADEETERPESFDDLLVAVSDLEGIVFTGDPDAATALDEIEVMGIWAGKAWDALTALNDYVKARIEGRCDRDVDGYLRNTPEGCRGFSANRHAADESHDVQNNARFRSARVFPVPAEVDRSCSAFMPSHFKIAQFGTVSPRLHYLNDAARTGKAYVGYIGHHLPTKRTN